MDVLKSVNCDSLSHDLILNGSQSFYDKIFHEDPEMQFLAEYPYPVQAPLEYQNDMKVRLFQNNIQNDTQKKISVREFKRMKNEICGQNFQSYAFLPNFFIDYMEKKTAGILDFGFNISYSQGILQKFYNKNELYFIRPNADNNLMICRPEMPDEEITLQWLCSDPILHLQNMNIEYSNYFIIRGRNTIHLTEIDSDFQVKVNLKLNCNVGFSGTALNHINKTELAIMDTRNKLKLFHLEMKSTSSTYTMQELNLDSKPRLIKFDYLTENILMIITDKHIKILDTRCKDVPQDIDIQLDNCDILLNFTLDKSKKYLSDVVYMSSKHSYFIYDVRMTSVHDFIHHNLGSPPCFIDYFDNSRIKMVTLFSQSPNDRAIFGTVSPYSLPFHLITLEDTYDRCRSQKNLPLIPDVQRRLNYPVTGVQIIPDNEDVSIYFTNIFGELFRQDILLKSSCSDKPIERMYNWLSEIYEKDDTSLNIVHFANASAAFALETEFNEVDLYDHYEKCNVNKFLEGTDFNIEDCKAEAFIDIWRDDQVGDMNTPLQSESSINKVEEWIENAKFEIDKDIE